MSEREIVNRLLKQLSKEEKELADAVGYVLINIFPSQKVKFNKRFILKLVREYLKHNKNEFNK